MRIAFPYFDVIFSAPSPIRGSDEVEKGVCGWFVAGEPPADSLFFALVIYIVLHLLGE
jgi:hypothetical protein